MIVLDMTRLQSGLRASSVLMDAVAGYPGFLTRSFWALICFEFWAVCLAWRFCQGLGAGVTLAPEAQGMPDRVACC